MRLRNHFREARGHRSIADIARECHLDEHGEKTGLSGGVLSLLERGRLLPTDLQVPVLERAYGRPIETLYSPLALRAVQEDEDT